MRHLCERRAVQSRDEELTVAHHRQANPIARHDESGYPVDPGNLARYTRRRHPEELPTVLEKNLVVSYPFEPADIRCQVIRIRCEVGESHRLLPGRDDEQILIARVVPKESDPFATRRPTSLRWMLDGRDAIDSDAPVWLLGG